MPLKDSIKITTEKVSTVACYGLSAIAMGAGLAFEAKGVPAVELGEIAKGIGCLAICAFSTAAGAFTSEMARMTEEDVRATANLE